MKSLHVTTMHYLKQMLYNIKYLIIMAKNLESNVICMYVQVTIFQYLQCGASPLHQGSQPSSLGL